MSFNDFGLHESLLRGVRDLGFAQPTPVQQDAIPPAMQGRDLLACAMTGSGKTAAFVLPILHRLLASGRPRNGGGPRALVLTPTRELAAQVTEHLALFARHTPLRGAAVFGGVGMGPQERAFRTGVDVLVATPGRLLDHLSRPYARLDALEYLVLDEADRMLDMGFLPDVRRILRQVPERRQTLLFSATVPPPIVALAREMLDRPVALNIERRAAPATGITHTVYAVPQTRKSDLLLHLLEKEGMESVVAFTRTKHRANRVARWLAGRGVACAPIHGNRSQSQRTLALSGFKRGDFRVLVATDLAARGIDVEALSHVVNYDVPNVADDYIHRVGRTARAEATGDAITFVSPEEEEDLRSIEQALGRRIPRAPTPGLEGGSPGASEEPLPRERPAGRPHRHPAHPTAAAPASAPRPRRPAGGGGPRTGKTSFSGGAVAAWSKRAR